MPFGGAQLGGFQHPTSEDGADQAHSVTARLGEDPVGLVGGCQLPFPELVEGSRRRRTTFQFAFDPDLPDLAYLLWMALIVSSLPSVVGSSPSRRPRRASSATLSACVSSGGVGIAQAASIRRSRLPTSGVHGGGSLRSTRASTRSQFSWNPIATRRNVFLQTELVELADRHEIDAAGDRSLGGMRVVEQAFEQVLPAFLEGEVALELVEHAETGRQSGGDRELGEQAPGERVQGADRGVVELVEGGLELGMCEQVGAAGGLGPQGFAEAVAEIGGGLLGEGDGGDGADVDTGANQLDDARHQARRLAGAGPRFDEQVGAEVAADPVAIGLVRRGLVWRRHSPPPPEVSSTRSNHAARRGSSRLRSHSCHRSVVPNESGSQKWQST